MKYTLLPFSFSACLLLLSSFPMHAEGGYDGPRWSLLDQKQVVAAAAGITLAKYPDCDSAIVDSKLVRVYRADGAGESQDENYEKILTDKGQKDNRTLTLSFMLPYTTVEVVKVEVIKANGQVVSVDVAANSKEMIDDSQMEENIYDPNSKLLKVNIPQLDKGDVIHSVTRTTTHRSIIPGEYADENIFESEAYIRHITYEVEAPQDKPLLHIALRDEVPGTVKYFSEPGPANSVLHRWEVTNVPRMFAEPAMPDESVVLQRLLISTTPDWQTISKWYWNLSQTHLAAQTPEMKTTVDDLVRGAATDLDKVKAIFYYVSKRIRYMGLTPEKDRPGFEPHDVRLTFCNKYGVCRDKAALLVAMLRLAGIEAYPVLTSVGAKKDSEVPDPGFNHAIVGIAQGHGHYLLMDPTDENTRVLFPSVESDQSYLVARPEGETILTSAVVPPEDNMVKIRTQAVLNSEGRIEAQSDISFEGFNDNAYRSFLSQMKPDDERRFFEGRLKLYMPGAHLQTLVITPQVMTDDSQDVHAHLEFTVGDMAVSGGGKAVVNLPWLGRSLALINYVLKGASLDKRKYPMKTYVACGFHEELQLQLGSRYTSAVSIPAELTIDDPCLGVERKVEFKDGVLTAVREAKLKVVEFSPEEYLQLKKNFVILADNDRKVPVLAVADEAETPSADQVAATDQPQVDSNALVLDSSDELAVKDLHNATLKVKYRKLIQTYEGKKSESEVKVNFDPAYQDVQLVRGRVTSKTGQIQDISPGEINILDDSWNGSAKRYTGGKILVANLPAVDVGSVIDVEYDITDKQAPFLAGYEAFQTTDFLENNSFLITAPVGLNLQKLVNKNLLGAPSVPPASWWEQIAAYFHPQPRQSIEETSSTEGGLQKFFWRSTHVSALPDEQSLPPDWNYAAGVTYFVGDRPGYLNELLGILQDRSSQNTQAVALAKKITVGAPDPLAKAVLIRDFVDRNIRVAGPKFTTLPLSELSAADTTLSDGYGHTADRAILLQAMLTAVGLPAEFVLASNLPAIHPLSEVAKTFPLPSEFSDLLVKVSLDGNTYYFNDTNQYAQIGETAHEGKLSVVLKDQSFEVVKPVEGCQNQVESFYQVSINDDGRLQIGYENHYYGNKYSSMKQFYAEMPPEEIRRYYQKIVSNIAQGARPVSDLTTDFHAYPGIEKYAVEIQNYAVVDGKFMYFDLPLSATLFSLPADQRTLPLLIDSSSQQIIHVELDLPPSFSKVTIAPISQSLPIPDGAGQATITASSSPGKYLLTYQLAKSPGIISPKQYPALLKVEASLEKKSAKLFLLEQ